MSQDTIQELTGLALEGQALTREQGLELATWPEDRLDELLDAAQAVRRRHFGNRVRFCSIVSGKTGGCSEDCAWCAQSGHHRTHIPPATERTDLDRIVLSARQSASNQAACFCVVNSGRRPTPADLEQLSGVQARLAAEGLPLACASLGELDEATAWRLAEMGVRRYNHNLETSRQHYARVVSTHRYDDRLATLRAARSAGLELCCGGIFGLGEEWADRVDLALTLRDEVRPQIVPLNFLHPIPGTRLADQPRLGPRECLKIIALFRFLLPRTDLKVAGGRAVNLGPAQRDMFRAGATSCIVGNLLTTCGPTPEEDRRMVEELGLEVVDRFSDS